MPIGLGPWNNEFSFSSELTGNGSCSLAAVGILVYQSWILRNFGEQLGHQVLSALRGAGQATFFECVLVWPPWVDYSQCSPW